ncbi:GNAT family N-acetyltransferase [Actinopolyspora mzabensis]|uniref:GNAT family N-acetyltransferase n=1 Tax=Actinopolyspora mzabensis TaxID=995066 RepID=UPI000B85D2F3|nr:GNAT family N-acetyltransferase [Actinopolyspora mzabensis]
MENSITVRDATPADILSTIGIDPLAEHGDATRSDSIHRYVETGKTRVAEMNAAVVGYCVVDRSFFGHEFVVLLTVDERVRRHGVGAALLRDAEHRWATTKLFTSTNLSNHAMQSLLFSLGWQSAGIVYGLDEGDPELFFIAPR